MKSEHSRTNMNSQIDWQSHIENIAANEFVYIFFTLIFPSLVQTIFCRHYRMENVACGKVLRREWNKSVLHSAAEEQMESEKDAMLRFH